jgi:hypothetical protein
MMSDGSRGFLTERCPAAPQAALQPPVATVVLNRSVGPAEMYNTSKEFSPPTFT